MSKKLAAKNALIGVPLSGRSEPNEPEASPLVPRTRTAVGGMAQFVTTQSPIHREAEQLREAVKAFEGARVVRSIDPALIIPSAWANRHGDTFKGADFAALKREIKEAGGNVQPIKIRPLIASTPGVKLGEKFEIVFGHRRHQACLDLDIPVNALIESVDDRKLFEEMERENRGRKNLSPWEQGRMYQAALDRGLYASQRKLSESIGVDVSLISKSIALAKLPMSIIEAFSSPLDVQFRWAQPLTEAVLKNPEAVVEIAKTLAAQPRKQGITAGQIFAQLTEVHVGEKLQATVKATAIQVDGAVAGQFTFDSKGGVTLRLNPGSVPHDRQKAFMELVEAFLKAA